MAKAAPQLRTSENEKETAMGLDMYLQARTGAGWADWASPDEKIRFELLTKEFAVEDIIEPSFKFAEVKFVAIYWRKVNQIHNWFVQNVQGGVDDCKPYYVTKAELMKLQETVQTALATRDSELLPPTAGAFFGSYEIDDWYWQGLEHTRDSLARILPHADRFHFIYESSW